MYVDDESRLCGAQTLTIKRLSNFLDASNAVIRRQVAHGIRVQRAKVEAGEKKPEDAPSVETATLLENACAKGHNFLTIQNRRLVARVPLGEREYLEFKKEILDNKSNPANPKASTLPEGITATYRDKTLTLTLGEDRTGVIILKKECFAGYSENALLFVREKYPSLIKDRAKVEVLLERFLAGGD